MWKPATMLCVAIVLGGCAVRESRPPMNGALRAALASPVVAPSAVAPSAAPARIASRPSSDHASHGSAAFGRSVRAREPQLQFCYREALATSANLSGSATIAVTLTDAGAVRDAAIVRRAWSGKGAEVVERCVLSTVRSWGFPPVDPRDDHVHSFSVIFTK